MWSPTVGRHPEAFAEDGRHRNALGMKIMAEARYRALAGDAARDDIVVCTGAIPTSTR